MQKNSTKTLLFSLVVIKLIYSEKKVKIKKKINNVILLIHEITQLFNSGDNSTSMDKIKVGIFFY